MKSIVIIGDGMADWPIERLDKKTPLMVAKKPNIDRIAREGCMGTFDTIPEGLPLGSAVANLSVIGYDPFVTFQGRAVLEAASIGVELDPQDVALRCNLICVQDGKIKNHSAGHIESDESKHLIDALQEGLGSDKVAFHMGISYRHLLVLKGGWANPKVDCAPPHDHVGEKVTDLLTKPFEDAAKTTADTLVELYKKAQKILEEHPINKARVKQGKDPANAIWPWSPGKRPSMKTMNELFGIKGAVISAVDLVKGLGCYAGCDIIDVPGATGLWDTNYEGKAAACLDALADHDFVYVHVEATDEAGHSKDLDLKIKCIEMLDSRVVKPILDGLKERGIQANVAILPDHPTPVETGCHANDPVPVALMGPGIKPDSTTAYDEQQAKLGSLGLLKGDAFIKLALDR